MNSKYLIALGVMLFIMTDFRCAGAPSNKRSRIAPTSLFQDSQIYITVSPEAGFRQTKEKGGNDTNDNAVELLDRMLVLHWQNFDNLAGDYIGLYSQDPADLRESEAEAYLLEQHPISSRSGKVKTSVRYERIPLNPYMDPCLGFWVAYLRENPDGSGKRSMKSECLRIHPTWMNDVKDQIKNVPIRSLMIPGTHNAGSWHHYAGFTSENPYTEYTFCQEDTIYDQLINGIRSLDVRVGYYRNTQEKFYINHDIARIRPLSTLLEDVKQFVEETNEIVMLDFHRFPVGFDDQEIHDQLVDFVFDYLGNLMAPKSLGLSVTAGELWELGQNIVIFYGDEATVDKHDVIWPGVYQAWADANKVDQLESYLQSSLSNDGCSQIAWSAMAHLTSTAADVILRPSFGIRGYSNLANDEVSNWFQREVWYSRSMIVAVDFYRSTNLIETAIEVNRNHGNTCL